MHLLNATCPTSHDQNGMPNVEEPIIGSLKFQTLLLYISAGLTGVTALLCLLLAFRHLACYIRPREQRQILRIAFLPVVFTALSCLSVYSYEASQYLGPARDLYEPVALAAIFLLFVEFAAPDLDTRERYFYELENKVPAEGQSRFSRNKIYNIIPGGSLRWYQSKYVAVFIYFFVTIVIRLVQELTQAAGRYCQASFSPAFAHIWVLVISSVALPIGVIAVIQFYFRLKSEPHFKIHKPTAKLFSFKAIILIMFIQEIVFAIVSQKLKSSSKVTARDLGVGLQNCLICLEQTVVAIWFHWSFSTREYRELRQTSTDEPFNIFRAALDALNPADLFVAAAYSVKLLFGGVSPRGSGHWSKSGGYERMDDSRNVQMQGVPSHSPSGSVSDIDQYPKYNDPRELEEQRSRSPMLSVRYQNAYPPSYENRYDNGP